ncbi:Flotillin-like protein 1 [Camellia lanceoleosa]|uniref:Flotillin-like protein 1 n=1 Tax=Camellia lanceoleosa TaxID=1840588 RepID=A0ACC0HEU8_9ERIC|nr:Flotillin-like protein 1 [Camellia lanceoleosa]
MSVEKLPFILPAVFTIGPRVDSEEGMLKYAKLISPHDMLSNHVTELVQGVIEGETRVLPTLMTMEQIFKGTKEFKKEVFDKVQLELDQFGLHIYIANVKQLDDVRGHERIRRNSRCDLLHLPTVWRRELYSKKKEAEGIAAVVDAQGFYLRNLLKEANGNYAAVRDYMMINSGANNGGGEGGAGGGGMKDVVGVYSMLPPLFQTVHEQTRMLPPARLGTLPSSS